MALILSHIKQMLGKLPDKRRTFALWFRLEDKRSATEHFALRFCHPKNLLAKVALGVNQLNYYFAEVARRLPFEKDLRFIMLRVITKWQQILRYNKMPCSGKRKLEKKVLARNGLHKRKSMNAVLQEMNYTIICRTAGHHYKR